MAEENAAGRRANERTYFAKQNKRQPWQSDRELGSDSQERAIPRVESRLEVEDPSKKGAHSTHSNRLMIEW